MRTLLFSLPLIASMVLLTPACKKNIEEPTYTQEEISWPPPPEPTVVRWTGHIANSSWADPPSRFQEWVAKISGNPPGVTFRKPYAVTTDKQGRIYVSDTGWGMVLMFDQEGKDFDFVGDSGQGALQKPAGLTTDSRGHIFVADLKLARVLEYTPDFEFIQAYGGGLLMRPVDVTVVEGAQEVWVTDSKAHNIQIFNFEGQHLRTIGKRGLDDGDFNFPTNLIASAEAREVYVVDTFNFRIQVFDEQGNFLRKWGRNCDSFGCFARAKGIALDPDGHIYVVDAAFNNVQVFDKEGNTLLFFGGIGNGPGQMWLPAGIHISEEGEIYVVSQYNWRVNTYQYLGAPTAAVTEP